LCGCGLEAISILLHLRPVGSIVVLLDWFPPWSLGPFVVPVPGEPRTVGLAYVAQMVWLVPSRHAPHVSEGAGAGLAAGAHRVRAVGTDVEGLGSAAPALSVRALLLLIRTHFEDQLGSRAVCTGGLGAVRASGGLVLLVPEHTVWPVVVANEVVDSLGAVGADRERSVLAEVSPPRGEGEEGEVEDEALHDWAAGGSGATGAGEASELVKLVSW